MRLIWGQGIVEHQQCYNLTCEDALTGYIKIESIKGGKFALVGRQRCHIQLTSHKKSWKDGETHAASTKIWNWSPSIKIEENFPPNTPLLVRMSEAVYPTSSELSPRLVNPNDKPKNEKSWESHTFHPRVDLRNYF